MMPGFGTLFYYVSFLALPVDNLTHIAVTVTYGKGG